MPRDKNDGQWIPPLGKASLQFGTIRARHSDIEQYAAGVHACRSLDQLTCALVERNLIARCAQQTRHGRAKRGIIVDDVE
jgi:hypothetical protein